MTVNNPETTQARPHLGWVLGLTSTAFFMVVLNSVVRHHGAAPHAA